MDLPQTSEDVSEINVIDISGVGNDENLNEPIQTETASNPESKDNSKKVQKQKREMPSHPPISQMVLDSIKGLKKRKGTSAKDIHDYLGDKYDVDMKILKGPITRFLKTAVHKGVLEQVSGVGSEGMYKIKKDNQNSGAKGKDHIVGVKRMDKMKKEIPRGRRERIHDIKRKNQNLAQKGKNVKTGEKAVAAGIKKSKK